MIDLLIDVVFYSLIVFTVLYSLSKKPCKSTLIASVGVILTELLLISIHSTVRTTVEDIHLLRFCWFSASLLLCSLFFCFNVTFHNKFNVLFSFACKFVGFLYLLKGFNFIIGYIGIYFLEIDAFRPYYSNIVIIANTSIYSCLLTSMLKDMTKTPLRRWLQRGKSKVHRGA